MPPKPIKLSVPGWAGDSRGHGDGDKPQPWHCVPFVEASTYGLELIYPFESETRVTTTKNGVEFDCPGFEKEFEGTDLGLQGPPFSKFAPGHYGMSSSLDIKPPSGFVLRLEPHPKFFTDTEYTTPLMVPGHIQSWWSHIFFVVFKSPPPGQTHIFRKNEPYGQILIVPERMTYDVQKMSDIESMSRQVRENKISSLAGKLCKHSWTDHLGNTFNDKYKQLNSIYARKGERGVEIGRAHV